MENQKLLFLAESKDIFSNLLPKFEKIVQFSFVLLRSIFKICFLPLKMLYATFWISEQALCHCTKDKEKAL